jgi:hypothetical protein
METTAQRGAADFLVLVEPESATASVVDIEEGVVHPGLDVCSIPARGN